MHNPDPTYPKPPLPSQRKMVLLYNHADPDESFVANLTDEEYEQMCAQEEDFSRKLMAVARANEVEMPTLCYYA